MTQPLRRVGILFSGGPAPAANSVIGAAASAFRRAGCEVIGIRHGYGALQALRPRHAPARARGGLPPLRRPRPLGAAQHAAASSWAPGAPTRARASVARDLDIPAKTDRLRRVHEALGDLELDALISIGGDDTLRTANFLYEYQKRLPPAARRVHVVHVPKTIDNDYRGHRLHLRLLHRGRRDGGRAPQPARRRHGHERLLHRRDDGAQGRLARVRRRHRGRGAPGHRRRGRRGRPRDRGGRARSARRALRTPSCASRCRTSPIAWST